MPTKAEPVNRVKVLEARVRLLERHVNTSDRQCWAFTEPINGHEYRCQRKVRWCGEDPTGMKHPGEHVYLIPAAQQPHAAPGR
jgi:hypothetical protein